MTNATIKKHEKQFKLSVWLRALRAFAFPASIVPVLLGAALALSCEGPVMWQLLPVVFVCSLLFHAGTNVLNDYFDFMRGVDRDHTLGSSRVLVDGLLEPKGLLVGGWVLFGVGCLLGLVLVAVRGIPMLVLGVIGLLGGYLYTGAPLGYKYIALGDIGVFILMGPLMVIGSYFALTGTYADTVLYASLPVGCLVAAILHSNNLRDITYDAEANVRTMANLLGHRAGRWEYVILVLAAYGAVVAMICTGVLAPLAWIVFASLPLAAKNMKAVWKSTPEEPQALATIDARTAQHHLVFGLLLVASVAGTAWIG